MSKSKSFYGKSSLGYGNYHIRLDNFLSFLFSCILLNVNYNFIHMFLYLFQLVSLSSLLRSISPLSKFYFFIFALWLTLQLFTDANSCRLMSLRQDFMPNVIHIYVCIYRHTHIDMGYIHIFLYLCDICTYMYIYSYICAYIFLFFTYIWRIGGKWVFSLDSMPTSVMIFTLGIQLKFYI